MGDPVKQTPHSEVATTLELFDSLGVTHVHPARLRSDPETVERVVRLILGTGVQFDPGVLDAVCGLGGQFAGARMTTVPGGETFETQGYNGVIDFWLRWYYTRLFVNKGLVVAPSIGSQVIYLPDLLAGSLGCTYDKVEESPDCVQDVLDRLPTVRGLRWIVGNTPTINRVLANHLERAEEYLLPVVYTWTTDTNKSDEGVFSRLVVGRFSWEGVNIEYWHPGRPTARIGLFPLGVPHQEQDS